MRKTVESGVDSHGWCLHAKSNQTMELQKYLGLPVFCGFFDLSSLADPIQVQGAIQVAAIWSACQPGASRVGGQSGGFGMVKRALVCGTAAGEAGNGPRRARGAGTGMRWLWLPHALRSTGVPQGVPPARDNA
jgi:hypothetical protein